MNLYSGKKHFLEQGGTRATLQTHFSPTTLILGRKSIVTSLRTTVLFLFGKKENQGIS